MLLNACLLISLSALAFMTLRWAFTSLPNERWQMLASVPADKTESGHWQGTNFTYYGFFSANAYVAALVVFFLLMGALGVALSAGVAIVGLILVCCVPASQLVAAVVEHKKHTFTVGGASFVGALLAPWILLGLQQFSIGHDIPLVPVMSALSIAYCLGEGLGRLACISFGCCYGKRLADCHPVIQHVFRTRAFVFTGLSKKVAYEGNLQGVEILPIQAVTASLYTAAALMGVWLFLAEYYMPAYLLTVIVSQGWRVISEFGRADHRGTLGRTNWSAYQVMALIAIAYAVMVLCLVPNTTAAPHPDLVQGIVQLWNTGLILALQGVWIGIFLYTGRSRVTGSNIEFFVHSSRI